MSTIQKRYDFVLLFDVQDGNPNGDPDAGNLPRIDPETGHGLVTDVCLKRKVRNYVLTAKAEAPGYDIFIKEKAVLNSTIEAAHKAVGSEATKAKKSADKSSEARLHLCKNYFDIRTFGAVLTTGLGAGQVRGPVQMTFGRSVTPIVTLEHAITRMAVTTVEEAEKQAGDNRTMGRKNTVPYGLYRSHGFVSPALATQTDTQRVKGTGFSEEDLALFWKALEQMFEHDRSAARGLMTTRALIIFEHANGLGDATAASLFDRVTITPKGAPPRSFGDFDVLLDGKPLSGVRTVVPVASAS